MDLNIKNVHILRLTIILLILLFINSPNSTFAQQAFKLHQTIGKLKIVYITTPQGKLYGIADSLDNLISAIKYAAPPKIPKHKAPHLKLCKVRVSDSFGKPLYGLINRGGKEVLECVYDEISNRLDYDYILLRKDNKYGIINQKCELVAPLNYDNIIFNYPISANNAAIFQKGNRWGLMTVDGNIIADAQFNSIEYYDHNQHFIISKGNKIGYLNNKGKFCLSTSPMFLPEVFPQNMEKCKEQLTNIEAMCQSLDCSSKSAKSVIGTYLKSNNIDAEEIKIIKRKGNVYWTYQNVETAKSIAGKPCWEKKYITYYFSIKKQKMVRKKKEKKIECTE